MRCWWYKMIQMKWKLADSDKIWNKMRNMRNMRARAGERVVETKPISVVLHPSCRFALYQTSDVYGARQALLSILLLYK